jgi:hypothetical protein
MRESRVWQGDSSARFQTWVPCFSAIKSTSLMLSLSKHALYLCNARPSLWDGFSAAKNISPCKPLILLFFLPATKINCTDLSPLFETGLFCSGPFQWGSSFRCCFDKLGKGGVAGWSEVTTPIIQQTAEGNGGGASFSGLLRLTSAATAGKDVAGGLRTSTLIPLLTR